MVFEWLNATFSSFDGAFFEFYNSLAVWGGKVLTPIMVFISAFGKSGLFPIILSAILLLFRKTRKIGLTALVAIGVSALITNALLKPIIARPRPYTFAEYESFWRLVGAHTEKDYAFPSGHVTIFTACMLGVFLSVKNKKRAWWLIFPVVLMGVSRNYLIVHYTTDIIVGYLVACIGGTVGYFVVKWVYAVLNKHKDEKAVKFLLCACVTDLIKRRRKMKIAVLIANGSEEIETITPVDIIRRTGATCETVSVNGKTLTCSRGVVIVADKLIEEVSLDDYDGIVIPGGMPGATNIAGCEKAIEGVRTAIKQGKVIASICASPAVVLASNGLIDKRKATCYPAKDFIDKLGESYTGNSVEVDGNLITANGPESAMEFSLKICEKLNLKPKF